MTRKGGEVVRLGEIIKCYNGKSVKALDEGKFKVFGSNGIIGYFDNFNYENSIVLGRVGAYCGSVNYEKNKFFASDNTIVVDILNKKIVDIYYLYYLFITLNLRDLAGGAAQPLINQGIVYGIEISLPPLHEQQRIASILSAYDDLIENNTRRIALLELMAQTLYRQWFVEYKFPGYQDTEMVESGTELGVIPSGWEVKKIGEVGKVITGKTPSKEKKEFYNGDFLFIKTPDIHGNIYILETQDRLSQEGYNSQNNKTIPKNSICVSCIGTVGAVCITSQDSQTNQQINSIVPKNDYDVEYLYLLCSNLKDKLEGLGSNGVTLTNVNKNKFEKIEILYSNSSLLINFHSKTNPMFDEMLSIQKQNQSLKEQRDLLIRKLIG